MFKITLSEGYNRITLTAPDKEEAVNLMMDIIDGLPDGGKIELAEENEAPPTGGNQ